MKNIIITSGNCIEPIDSVRNIINSSSGKLGALICETLITPDTEDINNIYYICSRKTILPHIFSRTGIKVTDNVCNILKTNQYATIHTIYADSTREIYNEMKALLTDQSKNITHVIHARAISDYEVDWVSSTNKILKYLESVYYETNIKDIPYDLQTAFDGEIAIDNSTKISSDEEDLLIRLVKTPKIISYIKQWNPNVKLFGFKLLDSVSQDELFAAARKQMEKCHCDFVVANDISQINNTQHIAHIISSNNEVITCNTKQEIAEIIARIVINNE